MSRSSPRVGNFTRQSFKTEKDYFLMAPPLLEIYFWTFIPTQHFLSFFLPQIVFLFKKNSHLVLN